MVRIFGFFKKFSPGILSGLLVVTSCIPFPPWALFWGLVPLWVRVLNPEVTWKESLWQGWWTQFLISLIGFHWVASVSHEFGYLPWPVAVLVLLAFSGLVHLYIPLATGLTAFLRARFELPPVACLVFLVCLHSAGEMLWPSVFAWNLGYHLLWAQFPMAQWADTIGFLGLSFVVLCLNALIVWIWIHRENRKLWMRASFSGILFLAFINGTGYLKKQSWDQTLEKSGTTINPLFIQANIGNLDKVRAELGGQTSHVIVNQFFHMTQMALLENPQADLVIWPETAIPFSLEPELGRVKVQQFYERHVEISRPLITGAFSERNLDGDWQVFNGLFFIDASSRNVSQSPYRKTHLLVFGEYVPFSDWFPFLKKLNPGGEGFDRGPGPTVISDGLPWRIGGQICYESLDPHFSRKLAMKGAQVFVNVTNDSWFGHTFETSQHLMATMARAIENRRPLLRSTNTGITGTIDASGRLSELSPVATVWAKALPTRIEKLDQAQTLTLYTRFGHWLTALPFLMMSLVLIVHFYFRFIHRSHDS